MENFKIKHTVRIYNSKILDKMESTYEFMKTFYGTKNDFMTECIKRGVESIEAEFVKQKGIHNISDMLGAIKQHTESIDRLATLSLQAFRDIFKTSKINEKMLIQGLSILFGLGNEKPGIMQDVLKGHENTLPPGFEEAVEKLLEHVAWYKYAKG